METITACENVCRDFSWLSAAAPGISALSALGTLILAFAAFNSWRKQALSNQKAKTAFDLISEANEFRKCIRNTTVALLIRGSKNTPEIELLHWKRAAREMEKSLSRAYHHIVGMRDLSQTLAFLDPPGNVCEVADETIERFDAIYRKVFLANFTLNNVDVAQKSIADSDIVEALKDHGFTDRDPYRKEMDASFEKLAQALKPLFKLQ